MLNGHDSCIRKQLFGVVVDELSVDETVDVVFEDHIHFLLHLLLKREGEGLKGEGIGNEGNSRRRGDISKLQNFVGIVNQHYVTLYYDKNLKDARAT